jgi:hypothetical protein
VREPDADLGMAFVRPAEPCGGHAVGAGRDGRGMG